MAHLLVTIDWLFLTTLLVSLGVGARIVVRFLEWHAKRPRLVARNDGGVLFGEFVEEASSGMIVRSRPYILGFFTLTNSGKTPLTPKEYGLVVEAVGHWVLFRSRPIPQGVDLPSAVQDISFSDLNGLDLLNYPGAIVNGSPVRGGLFFVSDQMTLDQLHQLSERDPPTCARLICIEVNGKRHECPFRLPRTIPRALERPLFGLHVRPKAIPELKRPRVAPDSEQVSRRPVKIRWVHLCQISKIRWPTLDLHGTSRTIVSLLESRIEMPLRQFVCMIHASDTEASSLEVEAVICDAAGKPLNSVEVSGLRGGRLTPHHPAVYLVKVELGNARVLREQGKYNMRFVVNGEVVKDVPFYVARTRTRHFPDEPPAELRLDWGHLCENVTVDEQTYDITLHGIKHFDYPQHSNMIPRVLALMISGPSGTSPEPELTFELEDPEGNRIGEPWRDRLYGFEGVGSRMYFPVFIRLTEVKLDVIGTYTYRIWINGERQGQVEYWLLDPAYPPRQLHIEDWN